MNEKRAIAPINCFTLDRAISRAMLMSHHDGYKIPTQYMYIIQRGQDFWVDSSRVMQSPKERLICSVFNRRDKPYTSKIVIDEMDNGFFVKHPDSGLIYAIYVTKKLYAGGEFVMAHFDPSWFTQLKHGNPNTSWPSWNHVNAFVRNRIEDYNRNFGL